MAQTLLEYSETGLGKTTSIGLFARHQYAKTGKPTYLITCDSGFGPVQPEVDDSIIIPLRLESCPHPVPVLNKLSKGLWPKVGIDVKDGLWRMGQGDNFVPYANPALCGGIAIEGLTRICELVRKAWTDDQQQIGEPLQGVHESMGEKFAFQSRGTMFGIQQLINNVVINFRGLPVDRVLWTAHEGKGKDLNGRNVLGPATTGQALTDKVAGWFEIVLHHDSYKYQDLSRDGKRKLTKTAIRAWFQRHPDVELPKMYWPAKLGLDSKLTAAMYQYFEEGYFPLILDMATGEYVQGLNTFLSIIDNKGVLLTQQAEQPVELVEETNETSSETTEVVGETVEPANETSTVEPVVPLVDPPEELAEEVKVEVKRGRARR